MVKTIVALIALMCFMLCCKKPETVRYVTVPSNPAVPVPVYTPPPPVVIPDTAGFRTFLALGDSYTIGQSVPETDRYPVQVVGLLNRQNIKFNQPEIIAQSGWTTGNLLARLASAPPVNGKYDIVTLLIGVNNQYRRGTQAVYRQEFISLLTKAIQYAGNNNKRVFVLSIPDYSVTPFASNSNRDLISKQIDSFNVINKDIALQNNVNYLDITGFTRLAGANPSLLASDGLHPSGTEYKVWAENLLPMIRDVLQ
jgi:lysophospholipase L1-like esterase